MATLLVLQCRSTNAAVAEVSENVVSSARSDLQTNSLIEGASFDEINDGVGFLLATTGVEAWIGCMEFTPVLLQTAFTIARAVLKDRGDSSLMQTLIVV